MEGLQQDLSSMMDEMEAQTGVVINFHDLSGLCLQIPNLRIRQDQHYHHGSYCTFAKRMGNQPHCAANKERSKLRAQNGATFSGYCPFGVWDHAHPVRFDDEIIGIVYTGSLQGDQTLAPIGEQAYTGPQLAPLNAAHKETCTNAAAFLAQYILIIIRAWVRKGNLLGKKKSEHFYLQAMHQFIETHYPKNISLQELAGQLNVHPNYLGNLISSNSDKTFRQHLLDYRCYRAQVFLRGTNDSITEIAFICGFQDSNYFSSAFKRHCGMTPTQYRKEIKQ